jgi:hypothetical protein
VRCKEVQETFEEAGGQAVPAAVREHLAACPVCRARATDSSRLAAGMWLLAREPVPEPSIGFQARVLRRLGDGVQSLTPDILENAGRRVIYATLILVLFLLLAMLVPSSGPWRQGPDLSTYGPQDEALTTVSYQVSPNSLAPVPVLVDLNSAAPSGP